MNKKNFFMLSLLCISMALSAQEIPSVPATSGGGQEQKSGQNTGANVNLNEGDRMFQIIVREDTSLTNTRGIKWEDNNRRLLTTDLFNLYRSTLAGKVTTASTGIISAGISFIYSKIASHRQDWMQAVQKECTYTKKLSMQTEIVDFYKQPSVKGAMDPADIVFDGFGCKQTIGDKSSNSGNTMQNGMTASGNPQVGAATRGISIESSQKGATSNVAKKSGNSSKDVFYVYCKLRTDSIGIKRITDHTKFEVVVDSISFNPYLCNLPNDSTAASTGDHIDFDFAKRNNLTFTLTANITSSWMNEAIQVYRDVPLGEFKVTAKIDDKYIKDSVFTYSSRLDKGTEKEKDISVSGDCFIIPRSYVGTLDGTAFTSAWGTGQYKIEMQVSESCSINRDYYMEKDEEQQAGNLLALNGQQANGQPSAEQASNTGKKETKKKKQKEEWNDKWKEEWNIIKKRQKSKSLWNNLYEVVKTEWTGQEWVTMIIEPALTTLATSGSNLIYEADDEQGGGGGMMPGGK
ncbi:MAG: hypothetical protein LUC91_00490 [Prevotella sp.]|nr:hypothetical protein [Prevotella sp.]